MKKLPQPPLKRKILRKTKMNKEDSIKWNCSCDTGSSFTDVLIRGSDGSLFTKKLLSKNSEVYQNPIVYAIKEHLKTHGGKIGTLRLGTTVGINALVQRKGASTLLLVSKGFKDLLKIGFQNRENLFNFKIEKPDSLYSECYEIEGRIDRDGNEIASLNISQIKECLKKTKCTTCAICFMNSIKNPSHEEEALEQCGDSGKFQHISVSHKTSPFIGMINRCHTSVIDAYLHPVVEDFVESVQKELGVERAQIMKSDGTLQSLYSDLISGKNTIMSGPAAGVIGAIETSAEDKAVNIDIGGCTCDCSHFNGIPEKTLDSKVEGFPIRVPMLNINSVGAGGGSILSFEDGRLQVKNESSGSAACFGKGAVLSLTDALYALGQIKDQNFPFPLDKSVVDKELNKVAKKVKTQTRQILSNEELSEGFVKIAVEKMASAIKKITIEKGRDITSGYILNSFGGAAGGYCCKIADILGIQRISIHPLAGVLSAVGISLAPVSSTRTKQINSEGYKPHDLKGLQTSTYLDVSTQLGENWPKENKILLEEYADLKYEGSDHTLRVKLEGDFKKSFEALHKQTYGFEDTSRKIIIDTLICEATAKSPFEPPKFNIPIEGKSSTTQMYVDGGWQEVPLIHRHEMGQNQTLIGPGIILGSTDTIVVDPGWEAKIEKNGNLLLTSTEQKKEEIGIDQVDPIQLEIFSNKFKGICDEMASVLKQTASSVNIKERLDFSCGLFNKEGDLIANSLSIPVHLGSMSDTVREAIKRYPKMEIGSVYLTNSPFTGGTHLPDLTLIRPIHFKDELQGFVASRAHMSEIGGVTPSSLPHNSTHIDQEGILIDMVQLSDGYNEELLTDILEDHEWPCRNIKEVIADLFAMQSACRRGILSFNSLCGEVGQNVVQFYMDRILDNAEQIIRNMLSNLKECGYEYEMDNGQVIKVKIIPNGNGECLFDFTGTSPQQGNFNAPLAIVKAVILFVLRSMIGKDIPLNDGILRPIRINVEEGSLLNPTYPAAVVAGNTEVSQVLCTTLLNALGIMAESQTTMNNISFGNETDQNYFTVGGGSGAGDGFHGASAVHSNMTNSLQADPEILEDRFNVRVNSLAIAKGTGGDGKFKGGDGLFLDLEFLEQMNLSIISSNRDRSPKGMNGGEDGAPGKNGLWKDNKIHELKNVDSCEVYPGNQLLLRTPGGGGFGVA